MTVEKYVRKKVGKICAKTFIAPNIPENKLKSVLKETTMIIDPKHVIALLDTTVFGNVKTGGIITGEGFYLFYGRKKVYAIKFENLKYVKYYEKIQYAKNGKVSIEEKLAVFFRDGRVENIENMIKGLEVKKVETFLNDIVELGSAVGEYKNKTQVTPLSMMEDDIKEAYMQIICNFVKSRAESIESFEYAEVMNLMTRLDIKASSRVKIRNCLFDNLVIVDTKVMLNKIEKKISACSFELVNISLIKDMIFIALLKELDSWRVDSHLLEYKRLLAITDKQMDCLIKTVKQEEEILSKNDNEIRQILIDIAANLSAVGVPMTAIYFSGSVIGISAVGITSGLAALGLGGMLIFSPMLAGIGVAVLLGVSAHNLVKKISDEGNNRYCRTKELMLQEVIKNLQMTMNYLIEDLNEISRQLSNEIKKGIMVKSEIEELANMISILTKSAESVGEKIENTQKENLISQLPEIIDESKVVKLTSEIELKKYHEYIMECYQVVEEKSCEDKKYYKLNDQLSENRLYKLKDAIEAIGYNDPLITHMLI